MILHRYWRQGNRSKTRAQLHIGELIVFKKNQNNIIFIKTIYRLTHQVNQKHSFLKEEEEMYLLLLSSYIFLYHSDWSY